MKKYVVLIVIFTLLFNLVAYANESILIPEVVSKSAILMDKESGRVLWGKNHTEKLPMASTTKIMTLLVALEKGDFSKDVVITSRASKAPDVQLNIKEGEVFKLGDLIYPLMLESSNDVAIAIAEHVGGDVETFCNMMTEKAKEIGAENTSFKTPNGLDAEGHYSTAYDLALITRYALENEKFVKVINTSTYTFKSDLRSYSVNNKNRLLTSYKGGNGVKTGFTNKAGNCFVGSASKNGLNLITVVLQAGWGSLGKEAKWTDTYKILNYGFDNYNKQIILEKREYKIDYIDITNSKVKSLPAYYIVSENLELLLNHEEKEYLEIREEYIKKLDAPVENNQKIGEARVYLKDELITQYDIRVRGGASIHDFIASLEKVISVWVGLGYDNVNIDIRSMVE